MSGIRSCVRSQPSRRRFLRQLTAALCLGTATRALGQDSFDRAAADESLEGRLFFWANVHSDPENTGFYAYDFATRKWPRVLEKANPDWFCRVSPDGKSFAITEKTPPESKVSVITPDGRFLVSELRSRVLWAPDGREVILSEWSVEGRIVVKTWRMNRDGTQRVALAIPDDELVVDWSKDGRWLLIARQGPKISSLYTWLTRRADGTEPRILTENIHLSTYPGRLSPDGRWVAYTKRDAESDEIGLWCLEVATRKARRILLGDAEGYPSETPCWSPDGKFLAVAMSDRKKDLPDHRTRRIEIVDLQGHRIRQLGIPHNWPVISDWR